jgi:hypothetical protein
MTETCFTIYVEFKLLKPCNLLLGNTYLLNAIGDLEL